MWPSYDKFLVLYRGNHEIIMTQMREFYDYLKKEGVGDYSKVFEYFDEHQQGVGCNGTEMEVPELPYSEYEWNDDDFLQQLNSVLTRFKEVLNRRYPLLQAFLKSIATKQ
jgi:hypothetical protein